MPNGGFDNCLTCWFNRKNKGEAGHEHMDDEGEPYCLIREVAITSNPAYTYCANSPHNTSEKIETPIGPIFHAEVDNHRRVMLLPAPDSEAIRMNLLELLAHIPSEPQAYPG